jgi:hypothetical protein
MIDLRYDLRQTAEYLEMMPPSFEDWTSQGPAAHPLPRNCVWSPDYVNDFIDDDEDDNGSSSDSEDSNEED